jgi:predicted dehydrogenase
MPTEKARIGVIGTGWWSTTAHLPGLKANPHADLVAVADTRPEALKSAADKYGPLKTYTDFREMLAQEQLQGVVVCVNHAAHYEVARACLEAGLHVMLDKPMVLVAREAHDLLNTARARGVELIIGYPWNYTDITRRARDIVQSGELGGVQYVSSLFTSMVIEFLRGNDEAYRQHFNYPVTGPQQAYADPRLSGGGQGHLQVTHSAAALFLVTDLRADVVTSFMQNFDLRVDVADAIAVRFQPVNGGYAPVGVLGSTANIGVGDGGHLEVQVYCEQGRIVLEEIQSTLYVRKHDGTEMRFGPLPAEQRYPMFAPANNLVDVILGRGKNEGPADVGVRVVELLDAAYRSAEAGGTPVQVADLL